MSTTLVCVGPWRQEDDDAAFGDRRVFDNVTEDALNFYAHGINNTPVPGVTTNTLTLPKYAWVREEQR